MCSISYSNINCRLFFAVSIIFVNFAISTLSLAQADESPLLEKMENYAGVSVIDGEVVNTCLLNVRRDDNGKITRMMVHGTSKRVSHSGEPPMGPEPTYIDIGGIMSDEERHIFTTFAAMPSIAHPGYQRIGLQINTGTMQHPWPGFQEVSYIAAKNNMSEIIARTDLYLFVRMIPLGSDEIRCEQMALTN